MLLSNPQHFTLQGTQRMDFMRQGNGGAVHIDRRPSALGQKRTSRRVRVMSALPPKADIAECERHVADIQGAVGYD